MKSKKELLLEAQNEQRQVVAKNRVSLLKALDELEEFGGKDDYETSLSAIVTEYGEKGISLTRVREVLPEAKPLENALQALIDAGEIEKGTNKRSPLLKTTTVTVKEPQLEIEKVDPVDDAGPAPVQAPAVPPKKTAGK
jgi:hypothetical protein